ncbi:hypothetical protein LPJ75_004969 [Coemansia sp. RSA 2598]|nr:hypothetical protein LPJ75_004969 [Coemansia sp. RSA 2598]
MDSQARKRTRPCDAAEMPGSFPSRQKLRRRRSGIVASSAESIDPGGLLSYVFFPVQMAKKWLFGSPSAAAVKEPQRRIHHGRERQGYADAPQARHLCGRGRKQGRSKGHRHKVPVTTPLGMHYRQALKMHHQSTGIGTGMGIGAGGAGATKGRRPLVAGNRSRSGGVRRDRTNELVRHYTMPYSALGAANSYNRWRSTSLASSLAPSQTASEAFSEQQSLATDDPSQCISFDSRSAISIDDSAPGRSDRAASPLLRDAKGARKMSEAASRSEEWIARLRRKIEQSLQVSVPAQSVSTPAFDRICRDEGDLESRIEKERLKKAAAVALPADADVVIASVFKPGFSRELNNTPVTAHDMGTLKPGTWLNDEVINFYMQLIMSRADKRSELPRVHAFNTFFYSTLRDGGYARVRRWTRKIKLFEKDLVVVPVHLGVHWCCATIDFRAKTIAYYDALLGDNDECLQLLKQYLCLESKDKLGAEFDGDGWSTVCEKDIPRQKNGYDCGVFAITFAEYLARDAQLAFSQSNCPALRRKIIYEIASGALL